MYQKHLANFPMISLVTLGELIFFTVFILISLWVYRRGGAAFYSQLSSQLLDLEQEHSHDRKR